MREAFLAGGVRRRAQLQGILASGLRLMTTIGREFEGGLLDRVVAYEDDMPGMGSGILFAPPCPHDHLRQARTVVQHKVYRHSQSQTAF